jgi:hypothetical protein
LQSVSNKAEKNMMVLEIPTDDSPFYFAKEQIPNPMKLLLVTVIGVSAVLALLLIYYSKTNKIQIFTSSRRLHILFVIFIGLGFMFLEITFIQKFLFLLLLGTPIMALAIILFSILLSTGVGAYLSGRLFKKNPYKAIEISIPILVGMVLVYYICLPAIIESNMGLDLLQRATITFALLFPVGLLMGFQFPSITRMASSSSSSDVTLLWGVNVIASVIGTVLTAISSMVIGFNGNLLVGIGLYLGALVSVIAAMKIKQEISEHKEVIA